MTPTQNEIVSNRALSGMELREILRQKLETLMDNEGLLNHVMAYGRVSFTLLLQLHLDNAYNRESEISVSSSPAAVNEPPSALEVPPLASPSPEAILSATQLDYSIDSPNAERLRAGLPVPVEIKQRDGTTSQENVTYPKDELLGEGAQKITNVTPVARAAWKK